MDSLKIDYHLSYYRSACHQLGIGVLPPKEFARIDAIRQASLVAIALEIGVIDEIGDARLKPMEHKATMAFIRRYENQEVAA
jgi:hypothetical protein